MTHTGFFHDLAWALVGWVSGAVTVGVYLGMSRLWAEDRADERARLDALARINKGGRL